jgi:ligand-binding sensor domain-containing protein/signal transduction histidine kinase
MMLANQHGNREAAYCPSSLRPFLFSIARLQICLAALLVSACLSIHAQDAASSASDWNYASNSWQSQNGLPGETVQSFAQTPDGFLWVGTSAGLLRFDGASFVRYSSENTPVMHENSVFSLLTSRDGHLWIGTDGGGLLEMHDGVFRAYSTAEGLSDGFIRALYEDRNGSLWVATDSGLYRLAADKFDRVDNKPDMPANAFHGLAEDHLGRLWAGAGQLYAIQNGKPTPYTLGGVDNQHRVKSILETADGSIWVGTIAGLYRMPPGRNTFAQVPGVWGTVRTLREVVPGELWAGTIGQGIFRIRYQEAGGKVSRVTAPNPLVSNTVLSIFADDSKRLWVGTQVGMILLNRSPVRELLLPTAADSDFGTVSLDTDGTLWAASNQLVHVIGDRVVPAGLPGLGSVHVRNVLRARDGSLWIGTDGSGVYNVTAKRTTHLTTTQGLVNNFIRAMLQSSDGTLWFATDSGLSRLDAGGFHNMTMDNGLSHFSTRSIMEDHDGDIWIGTERGVTHLRHGQPVHDTVTEALRDEKVWAEHTDPAGGLWFGTRTNGLYCFRNNLLTHYTTANGLATDSIYSILEDNHSNFWLSGPPGVTLLNRDELDAQALTPGRTLSLHFYRADAGSKPTQFYGGTQPAGVITSSGEAWFPTTSGLWRIRPTELQSSLISHLFISGIMVDGRLVHASSTLNLSASQSRVELSYEPVLLSSQEDLRFRYRMQGFDKDWTVSPTQQRSATYTNLPAGNYTFEVEAWAMDHPEHVVRASVQLVKQPYFYRTPWFIALCVLLAGLASVMAYQYRMRQIHGRFEAVLAERSRLAREMHDTLIQGCAGVSAMLEAAVSCEKEDHESRMHLIDYANTQIRAAMDEARQAVWNLRRDERAPSSLEECLEQMTERISREYGVSATCQSSGTTFPIGQQDTHELMMVAREALFNAVLHARPRFIKADLEYSPDSLLMTLSDDGQGFDLAAGSMDGHYGLQGMRERVNRFSGHLEIQSQPRRGTRVLVTIPRASLSTAAEDERRELAQPR